VPKKQQKNTKLGGSRGVGRAGDRFGGGAVKRCVNTSLGYHERLNMMAMFYPEANWSRMSLLVV